MVELELQHERQAPEPAEQKPALLPRILLAVVTGALTAVCADLLHDTLRQIPIRIESTAPVPGTGQPAPESRRAVAGTAEGEPIATAVALGAYGPPAPLSRPELRRLQLEVLEALGPLLTAPPEVYVGQVHAESRHLCEAVSGAAAVGCAQFRENAWIDIQDELPPLCRPLEMRKDPECSFIGNVFYVRKGRSYARLPGGHDLSLHSYNAGAKWTRREAAAAAAAGLDPTSYENGLKHVCVRRASACRESENYIANILRPGDGYADQVLAGDIEVAPPSPRTRRTLSFDVDSRGTATASLGFQF